MNQIISMVKQKVPSRVETRFSTFNSLAARYQDEAYTLAFYLLGDDARAARATQSAIADLYRDALALPENFRVEILRRVISQCAGADLALTNHARTSLPVNDRLGHELLSLKTNQRWVVVLIDVLGLGYEEAAHVLGCSTKQVTHWLAEARLNLATGSTEPIHLASS